MSNKPTDADREYWSRVAELGCIIKGCGRPPSIHHAGTGAGGRKDHRKVLPLCHYHHQGVQGIHTLSRRVWEEMYGSEEALLVELEMRLEMP